MQRIILTIIFSVLFFTSKLQAQTAPFTKGGATEQQTHANLKFYKWLKETYGMQLDIYALDAGNIDGHNHYGYYKSGRTLKIKK